MSSYLHLDLGEQAFERRRQVDGDALQVLAPEARPRNPALPGRPGAVLVVAVLVASKNGLRRRRRELEMQLPSNSCCFADWFGHEEELPQITVVHLAQDFNLQNSNRIGISKACPELNQKIADQRRAITRTS
jgi:hypothetical protein